MLNEIKTLLETLSPVDRLGIVNDLSKWVEPEKDALREQAPNGGAVVGEMYVANISKASTPKPGLDTKKFAARAPATYQKYLTLCPTNPAPRKGSVSTKQKV